MNYQEKFQKAKKSGYSDEEIFNYLGDKDPEFTKKVEKAKELGYSPEQVISHFNTQKKQKKEETTGGDYLKDFGSQYAQGLGIGGIGSYGDILELLGQSKDISPGEKAKFDREFDVLDKIQGGEKPSFTDLMELSEDQPYPRTSRLPTSRDIEEIGTKSGLVSEPKTAAGRYGKRIGRLQSSMAVTGMPAIAAPIAAGVAGQTLEEAGAPPWMQAAAEIIVSLKLSPKSATAITSKSPVVEETIQNLRKSGFSEKDITLAKNALEERNLLKKFSSLSPEAENSINQGLKNSENLISEQIKKGLPGYAEGGLPYLEKQASSVYQTMEDVAHSIPVKNPKPVQKAIQEAIDYLEKYPLLKEQKEFIGFLKEGLEKSANANTAEFYTGFYRNLGKAGNWGNPSQKEHLLGLVKDGIKQTFDKSGKEAKKFGEYFEKTNDVWKHWLNTKDVMTNFEKAITTQGIDFNKLKKILSDPETHKQASKVLGQDVVKNIESIQHGATAIESLLKQIPKTDKGLQEFKILTGIYSLLTKGDFRPLTAVMSLEGIKRLATDILINPEKQNRVQKIITAAKNNSPQQAAILAQELIKDESNPSPTTKKSP